MRGQKSPAELLVGLDVTDDAAVYLVARDFAIVETLDFFPPIVAAAYASGAIGALDAADLASAIASMVTLNRAAAQAAVDAELHAATDITGFGLAGHAYEMAERSSVALQIKASLVPLLPGAHRHAETGISFGGLERNQAYFDDGAKVVFDGIDNVLRTLMLDPQTSGGLLVGVPPAHADGWHRACAARGVQPVQIGEVMAGDARVRVTP